MFSKWSSYLFGSEPLSDDNVESAVSDSHETVTDKSSNNSNAAEVNFSNEEDDWILLEDVAEQCDDNEECLEFIDNPEIEELNDDNQSLQKTRSSSSCSSIIQSCNLDESWFMTPPPCFTITITKNNGARTIPSTFNLESNAIENLLIEHPSMSVYKNHHEHLLDSRHVNLLYLRHMDCTKENRKPIVITSQSEVDKNERDCNATKQQQRQIKDPLAISAMTKTNKRNRNYCRKNIVVPPIKLVPNTNRDRHYQVEEMANDALLMKLNRLPKKNNKAREINSRNNHQRRGNRSQGSHRSNSDQMCY